jgi:hypothetical protein
MLEKSKEQKLYEKADSLMDSFRDSVAAAREAARLANVPTVFVLDGTTYYAMPDGEIVKRTSTQGG